MSKASFLFDLYEIFNSKKSTNFKKSANGNSIYYWLFFIIVLYIIAHIVLVYSTMFEKDITVSEKYIRPYSDGGKFRVIDDKGNTYIVADNIYLLEFNSADDYAKLEKGSTYRVYGYWFRFPFFSWFPIIYKVDKK